MAAEGKKNRKALPSPRRRRSGKTGESPAYEGFYDSVVSDIEREMLAEAREIEGLDEEIALLRVKLMSVLTEHPENLELLIKGLGMLVRAVGAKYRLSKKAEDDLYQNILGVLQGVGGALFPEQFPQEE